MLRVVKLGGSLLTWPEWPAAWRRWLKLQPEATTVLIAGGGELVETLRQIDRTHRLPNDMAHWLAIDTMSDTAKLVAEQLPEARWCDEFRLLRTPAAETCVVFAVAGFMRRVERNLPGTPLPCGWHVTSDSIAARLAIAVGADEVVLLKSALPRAGSSLQAASDEGMIDEFFPSLAAELPPVRLVNLREEDFPQWVWQPRNEKPRPSGRG